jgi:hypothetical protein
MCLAMSLPGHATLYRPDYCRLAHNYCRLGANNAELARFFDVEPDDIATWIVNIPEFRAAVRDARGMARAKVWRGLYQRAVGYTCEIERTEIHRGELKTLTRTVHYAPDPRAGIYWLEHEEGGGGEDTPGDVDGNGGGGSSPFADRFSNDRDDPRTVLYPHSPGEQDRIENCPHREDTLKSTSAPESPLDQKVAASCLHGERCHPARGSPRADRSEGPFLLPQRPLAALGVTA